jgi:hypothetical protein
MELFQESVSVPVVEMAGDMPYGVSTPRNMSFKDFVQNHLSVEPGSTLSSSSKYYLKDWHYAKEYATKLAYKTPAFFVDDWLNRWWDEGRKQGGDDSDFKFLYLGGAGTFTSLHHDVFRSNSWSASISGRKRWIIYHPLEEPNLKDSFEQFAPTGQWGSMTQSQRASWPRVEAVKSYVDLVQQPGDIIFIPSGYYHEVYNLDECLSINHNWFNIYQLKQVSQFMRKEWYQTKQAIIDLVDMMPDAEFMQEVQKLMKRNTGMSLSEFEHLVHFNKTYCDEESNEDIALVLRDVRRLQEEEARWVS